MSNQLIKNTTLGTLRIYPKAYTEGIIDKSTGKNLIEILSNFNMYFLSYIGNTFETRCQVPKDLRREGLWITYVDFNHKVITEWYNSDNIDNETWGVDTYWRQGSNKLIGDISISTNGNWVINGKETEFKATGDPIKPLLRVNFSANKLQVSYDDGNKYENLGDNPVYTLFRFNSEINTYQVSYDLGTSWENISDEKVYHKFRTNENKLQVSTDLGTTWEDCSELIAAWFRWAEGDTANSVGKLLISRDELKTWTDLSPNIVNNLRIKNYVAAVDNLPSDASSGDIYMVGPTYDESDTTHDYPHYRMWVKLSSGWVDNGEYLSNVLISQTTGLETGITMSLKAITDSISKVNGPIILDVTKNKSETFIDFSEPLAGTIFLQVTGIVKPIQVYLFNKDNSNQRNYFGAKSVGLLYEIDKDGMYKAEVLPNVNNAIRIYMLSEDTTLKHFLFFKKGLVSDVELLKNNSTANNENIEKLYEYSEEFKPITLFKTIENAYLNINGTLVQNVSSARNVHIYKLSRGRYKLYGSYDKGNKGVMVYCLYNDESLSSPIELGATGDIFVSPTYLNINEDCYIALSSLQENTSLPIQTLFVGESASLPKENKSEIDFINSTITSFDVIKNIPHAYISKGSGIVNYQANEARTIQIYKLLKNVKYTIYGKCNGGSVAAYALYSDLELENLISVGKDAEAFGTSVEITPDSDCYIGVCSVDEYATDDSKQSMFVKHTNPTLKDDIITLEERVTAIESGDLPYSGKELFAIFDSLGSLGIWQKYLSEKTGMLFDETLNKALSIGGRNILDEGYNHNCAMYSTKYLIENFKSRAEKGYIFIENVHDKINGTIEDTPFFVENEYVLPNIYGSHSEANAAITTNLIDSISSFSAKPNSAIIAKYGNISTILEITTMPTAGTFYVVENVEGVEVKRYGITVSSNDALADVLEAISVYEYVNLVATVDENSVVFSHKNTKNITLSVVPNGTGIAISTKEIESTTSLGVGFVSKDITQWNSTSAWKKLSEISLYSKMKGQIEYIQKNLPLAKIYLVCPTYSIIKQKTEQPYFYFDDGSFNIYAWKNYTKETASIYDADYAVGNKLYQDLIGVTKNIGKEYGVKVLDLMNNVGISPINWLSYYAYGNSHPIKIGDSYPAYELWAEYISNNL